jgi:metallo-beta-lactamase family protein
MTAPMSLTFLGAAGTVTGSKFLLESGASRVLVDCGMFQGERQWRRRNWDPFPVDPATIAAVVVTHAHLDHCGYLPVLAREGLSCPVVCSPDTARLIGIVLRDAAHLQEQEAQWAQRTGLSKHENPVPLFDTADAEKALALLSPTPRHESRVLVDDIAVVLHRAGHILGSCFAALSRGDTRIVFSGDLGRPDHPLLLPPEQPGRADHFVVESTYGDRLHEGRAADELAAVLVRTLGRGGVALLPAFAVDRTALLLHEIQGLVEAGRVPDVPVYVDSPMALAALEVYRAALDNQDQEFRPDLLGARDPFDPGRLRLVHGPVESEKLNDPRNPCIVISASGMATGGRVLHHLEHQLPRSRNSVILTGYQVAGTRGRALADGAAQVKIHGRYIPVRAEIANIRGFSAHADSTQMLSWLRDSPEPRSAFVVHGEQSSAEAFAHTLRTELGWTAVVPRYQEKVRVDR